MADKSSHTLFSPYKINPTHQMTLLQAVGVKALKSNVSKSELQRVDPPSP